MFVCERCGSGYSAMRAVALQDCPRCLARDKVTAPLAFKAFGQLDDQDRLVGLEDERAEVVAGHPRSAAPEDAAPATEAEQR